MRGEFFRFFGAPNEPLRIIIIFWEQNNFTRVTTDPKKSVKRLDFGKTSYKDFVFARGKFFRVFGAPNESLIHIIIYYMLKYTCGNKTALLDSHRSQKSI